MNRTCLLGGRRPAPSFDDGRWTGSSAMKVKGRDMWTGEKAGPPQSRATVRVE